jgi:hypothetical protein
LPNHMTKKIASGRAFWICAGFTLVSASVSATFSVLSLSMAGTGHQHEYSLYATSRSIALLLATIFVMGRRSREGVTAMAIAMTIVQLLDAIVGSLAHNPGKTYGPAVFAMINAMLMVWMFRSGRD